MLGHLYTKIPTIFRFLNEYETLLISFETFRQTRKISLLSEEQPSLKTSEQIRAPLKTLRSEKFVVHMDRQTVRQRFDLYQSPLNIAILNFQPYPNSKTFVTLN
jgi:hypothetical protein